MVLLQAPGFVVLLWGGLFLVEWLGAPHGRRLDASPCGLGRFRT